MDAHIILDKMLSPELLLTCMSNTNISWKDRTLFLELFIQLYAHHYSLPRLHEHIEPLKIIWQSEMGKSGPPISENTKLFSYLLPFNSK